MDELHLPEIVKMREPLVGEERVVKNTVTTGEAKIVTGRFGNSSRDKRRAVELRQRRLNTKFSGGKVNGSRSEGKTHNTRRRNDAIGLPNIGSSSGRGNARNIKIEADGFGVKKTRQRRVRRDARGGDTISYVYSKSLEDENCMAFLRNCMDFEKDLTNSQRSSAFDKKPYGLPSLKASAEFINDRTATLNCEDYHEKIFEERKMSWNGWRASEGTDEDVSNDTNYDSADCSTGNER